MDSEHGFHHPVRTASDNGFRRWLSGGGESSSFCNLLRHPSPRSFPPPLPPNPMQAQCIDACHGQARPLPSPFLGHSRPPTPVPAFSAASFPPRRWGLRRVSCGGRRAGPSEGRGGGGGPGKAKAKENVWSVDNELAAEEERRREAQRQRRRRRGRRVKGPGGRGRGGSSGVLVSAAMLVEVETVLQTQEPVIIPSWDTFTSSLSGIWKGAGAVFSPISAEMEPLGIGSGNESLYDCYVLSRVEKMPSEGQFSKIWRKTNWVTLNPFGEMKHSRGGSRRKERDRLSTPEDDASDVGPDLPSYGSFDLGRSDILEEDFMSKEQGLVFFEDGSYSRGPVDIPVGEYDESKYFLTPTFKFEQCLVKGCHKRLRIVHTIAFNEGGTDIQIIRVALYEEQWVSPVNLDDGSDSQCDLKPLSQRKRTQPSELTGSWKVFEVSATPIFSEEVAAQEGGLPYVYLCTETLKKRTTPETPVYFGEEEMLDVQDVTVLWLPGGVTAYVDVSKDGILCIGVGWYSDEGINLVMERDYGVDGKLQEVRSKSEVKRRWNEPYPESSMQLDDGQPYKGLLQSAEPRNQQRGSVGFLIT
ncbi:hypothetical protein Taro_007625 [Colocasia esculenta]|uniref:Uncharacterized protein n=1 Tax=Colocasia esculenta TaxID=4460 RepID=A0A843TRQ3_COLES|nr:hypothetical protein [Colocasia esculenta]